MQARKRTRKPPSRPKNNPVTANSFTSPPPKPSCPLNCSVIREIANAKMPMTRHPIMEFHTMPICSSPNFSVKARYTTRRTIDVRMAAFGIMRYRMSVVESQRRMIPKAARSIMRGTSSKRMQRAVLKTSSIRAHMIRMRCIEGNA